MSIRARCASALAMVVVLAMVVAAAFGLPAAAIAGTSRDVQLIGLAPLYEVLFAVANCPNVALDEPAFRRAAGLYGLVPADLAIDGAFAADVAELATENRVRLADDRVAFCDARRLRFAVPQGVLLDRGPEISHPLPFAEP